MSSISIKQTNKMTGQELDGVVAYLPKKHKLYPCGFATVNTDMLRRIVEGDKLSKMGLKVLLWLISKQSTLHFIELTVSEMIEEGQFSRPSFYKGLNEGLNAGLVEMITQQGVNKFYRVNPQLCWTGKLKDYDPSCDMKTDLKLAKFLEAC